MNIRLQELINQSKRLPYEHNVSLESFAELIVRECIKAYNDDGYQTEYEQDQKILKHFGVEEPTGWVCPKCNADRTKIACPLGFGATVDGRCPMTVEAQ